MTTADPSIVEVIQTSTAREFLDQLHALAIEQGGEIFDGAHARLCFRGVGSTSFHLVPSALRSNAKDELWRAAGAAARRRIRTFGASASQPSFAPMVQFHLEFGVLTEFCRFAQHGGLVIPHMEPDFMEVIREPIALFEYLDLHDAVLAREWPPSKFVDALALAQHYGLPTRLLDWSRDVFTAAYFAASSSIERRVRGLEARKTPVEDNLAVWSMIETRARSVGPLGGPLAVPMPPYHGNPNLSAQSGVFTMWRGTGTSPPLLDDRPLTIQLHEHFTARQPNLVNDKVFKRIELPGSEAAQLLRILVTRGYSPARLFPGFGGAALAVQKNGWIDQLISGDLRPTAP